MARHCLVPLSSLLLTLVFFALTTCVEKKPRLNPYDPWGAGTNASGSTNTTNASAGSPPSILSFTPASNPVDKSVSTALFVSASDPDNDISGFAFSLVTGSGTFTGTDGSNGTKFFTAPGVSGNNTLRVTVSDTKGHSVFQDLTINVNKSWVQAGSDISPTLRNLSLVTLNAGTYMAYAEGASGYSPYVKFWNGSVLDPMSNPLLGGSVSNTALALNPFSGSMTFASFPSGGAYRALNYNGASWVITSAMDFLTTGVYDFDLMVDNTGLYHLAVISNNSGFFIAQVLTNGPAAWDFEGSGGISGADVRNPKIRYWPSMGRPIIGLVANSSSALNFYYWDGTSWLLVGPGPVSSGGVSSYDVGMYSNQPVVAYVDSGSGNRLTVRQYSAGSYVSLAGSIGFSTGTPTNISISANLGVPQVAYVDGGNPVVRTYNGTGWTNVGNLTPLTGLPVDELKLSISPDGLRTYLFLKRNSGTGQLFSFE